MSVGGGDTTWVGKKPLRRVGGMSDALSIAADLGFSVPPPPSQEDMQNLSTGSGEKGDDLIRILRELTVVHRKITDLQVELQGRKVVFSSFPHNDLGINFRIFEWLCFELLAPVDVSMFSCFLRRGLKSCVLEYQEDKNVAHLTHVSEMEKKIETLARITTILKDVILNKDRIIARLQQPYSLDCIPVEAEYQKQFSELLMKAASDYGALTASAADFQWTQNFKEPPTVWGEMLRPIPVALASCTRFFEAMTAMRESFAKLQTLRVGTSSQRVMGESDCVTPPWRTESSFGVQGPEGDDAAGKAVESNYIGGDSDYVDGTSHRRLSWPPPVKKTGV